MTTQLLTVSPAVVRAASPSRKNPADIRPIPDRLNRDSGPAPSRSTPPRKPRGSYQKGDWRYHGIQRRSRLSFFVCLLVSAALHVYVLFAFNDPEPVVIATDEVAELEITFMEMPPIEDLDEPEEVFEDSGEVEEIEAASYVPMQADVPSFNADAVFEQKMDLASLLPRPEFDDAKVVSIPPRISRSRMNPGQMKDLFDLADLDRAPIPLLQRPPVFPRQYKNTVPYAEVVVDFIVDSKGKVPWAKVTSSTHHGFEDAAVLGVSRWQFKPGTKNGKAVNTRMRVPLRFRVAD